MSNTKNLANLAAALDDGTSGQVLQSTGSGGVAFADSTGSGVTTHTNQAAMISADTSSAYTEGSLHFDLNANVLYVKIGSGAGDGFYAVATVENAAPTINSFSENTGGAGANNLTNATPPNTFTLTAGSNTVITINATEPNLETISYSATVTSGTATDVFSSPSFPVTNQSSNVFTLTPVTSGTGGTVTVRFDASDGTNVGSVSHSFEIAFIIADSHFSSLLMSTDGSAGDNNDITDSSSSNHTITVNGDAHAGTFSPYRHGGYSVEFVDEGSNGYGLQLPNTTFNNPSTTFTIEAWVYLKSYTSNATGHYNRTIMAKGATYFHFGITADNKIHLDHYDGTARYPYSNDTVPLNEWTHVCAKVDNGSITFYINGTASGTGTWYGLHSGHLNTGFYVGMSADTNNTANNDKWWDGYLSNVRFVDGTAITPASGGNEALDPATTNTEFLLCASNRLIDSKSTSPLTVTPYRTPKIVPIAPYDYNEYSASTNGGSVYFDGNDDLSATLSSAIGTGDFSISGWYYTGATPTTYHRRIFTIGGNNNANGMSFLHQTSGVLRLRIPANVAETHNYSYDAGQWVYFCIKRSSGTLTLHINGEQEYSGSDSTNLSSTSLCVGNDTIVLTSAYGMEGNLADFKISTSSIEDGSVPTSVVSSSGSILHIKGTDAHVLDKSQNYNLELVGTAAAVTNATNNSTISSTNAISLDGDSDYVKPNDVILPITQGVDYTIEGWFYADTITGTHPIVSQYVSGNGGRFLILVEQSTLKFFEGATTRQSISVNTGTWYHFLMCRSGTTHYAFMDGTLLGNSWTSSTNIANANTLIGNFATPTNYYFDGFLQDIRIYIGKARETSNFTVPSAPLKG